MQISQVERNNLVAQARENHLDFLYDLYKKEVNIGTENEDLLRKHGYFKTEPLPEPIEQVTDKINYSVLSKSTRKAREADAFLDIFESDNIPSEEIQILTSDDLEKRRQEHGHIFEGRKEPITRNDWMPKSTTAHDQDFIDWINSINQRGFKNKIKYRKFTLYCQQAYQWLSENKSYTDIEDEDDKMDFFLNELERCDENALYFLNKYVWYQEGNAEDKTGRIKYSAAPIHELLAYMEDCGYSVILAKGRQQAFSTTVMALNLRNVIFKANHFMKFICEDDQKAVEIFEDKLKFPFGELPYWMRPNVLNERDNLFKIGYKQEKGKKEGVGSKILVAVPKRTAVAGGAPQKVLIDEAGNIPILSVMIGNARPTMYWYNPLTKKMVIKRQIWIYGCVCAGTKVWTNKGKLVNIEDIKQEDGILGYNGKTINKEPITWIKPPAKKPCYRITTESGNFIECSNDHPLMIGSHEYKASHNRKLITFKKTEDVKIGDQLMMAAEVNVFGKKKMWNPRLIGLLIGDGSYGITSTIEIGGQDKEIHDYLLNNFNVHEDKNKRYVTDCGKDYRYFHIKGIRKHLRHLNIFGQTCDKKRLPSNVSDFDKKSITELIGGYFDADGNVCYSKTKGVRIVLTSTVHELLNDVKFQLMKLGIMSSIHKEFRGNNEVKLSKGQKDYIYRLYINNQQDVLKFHSEIKLLCKHKSDVLNKILDKKSKIFGTIRKGVFAMSDNGKGKHFIGNKEMEGLRFYRVKKIEHIGEKEIYNLTAGDTHTYIANGFVTHNTGGEMDKGGKAFETEYMAIQNAWNEGKYDACIVPIFSDWENRPGMSQELYDTEKRVAYAKASNESDPDSQKHITEFHQSNPKSLSDVFRTSAKTLIDDDYLTRALERIKKAKKGNRFQLHQSGYFEPIYDLTKPTTEGSDVPFAIIGANFVPTEDIDRRASTVIFMHPDKTWRDRYFKGTDPINTHTGSSEFSSTVWDKYYKAPVALMAWRVPDYQQVFLQSLLLNLYYDTSDRQKGIKELVESNSGGAYTDYMKSHGFEYELVLNYQLPPQIQNQTTINEGVGIDNKGQRNVFIIDRMVDVVRWYGEKIFIEKYFEQFKTFTCKISDNGRNIWGPTNRKHFMDDTLFGLSFAYICAELCFPELQPRNMEKVKNKYEYINKLVRGKDLKLHREMVKIPVK